ncbi:MAG TPA: putative glycolipid-binding domain-containing protein [Actinomycetes bacterium]|nr:putative glycolipid-binding domain-containing protein [Actinomycetes bacterium]
MQRVWVKDQPFGTELAEVTFEDGALRARGVAIGTEPAPYRLDYELTTTGGYVTSRLLVSARGERWWRTLDLRREAAGTWSCSGGGDGVAGLPAPGGDLGPVAGALDCDLALSPLTNTMPILRHGLHERGGPVEFLMAWVSVPDLAVHPSRQRYTPVRGGAEPVVRYDSLDGTFVAELRLDRHGLVLDYPGIGRRVA